MTPVGWFLLTLAGFLAVTAGLLIATWRNRLVEAVLAVALTGAAIVTGFSAVFV